MNDALADFGHWLRGLAHRYGLPSFWRWWMGELMPLVPVAPRAAIKRRRLRPVLAFGTDAAVLWVPRIVNGALGYGESARIPLAGDPAAMLQAGRAAIDALPHRSYGGAVAAAKVVIALPPGQVLRKRLTLPAAVEQDLRQALAYDLDRHTPFKPEELYFDAAVISRDTQRKEIGVDWAAALKSVVDQARRHAENWGATVIAVTPDTPGSGGPAITPASKLNLLPPVARQAEAWWRRWQLWVPIAAVGVAALIAIALPIWQKRDYAIALMRITEQARVQADAASALRQQLETMAADYNYVLGKKYAFPSTVQVVDDVTRLIPDDTWLTQFEMKSQTKGKDLRREMLLRGESANAGRLVTLLEESKLFTEAAPRSPTTKIQPGPGEIFDLGAQLVPALAPQPLQLASTPIAEPPTSAAAQASAANPATLTVPLATPAAPTPAPATPGSPTPTAATPAPTTPPGVVPAMAPVTPANGSTPTTGAPATPAAAAPSPAKDSTPGLRVAAPGEGPGVAPLPLDPGFGPPRSREAPAPSRPPTPQGSQAP
jgi:general secretion pathway protein L